MIADKASTGSAESNMDAEGYVVNLYNYCNTSFLTLFSDVTVT